MRILGIDTSTKYAGISIVEDGEVLAYSSLKFKATHSEKLLPELVHLLGIMEIPLETIDYYAITVGPGSFTGLRVGVSTIKGLSYVTGKMVIPLSTLEVIARGFPHVELQICPILDARRKEVYAALFKWDGEKLLRLKNDSVLSVDALMDWIKDKTIFTGDGIDVYRDQIEKNLSMKAIFTKSYYSIPSPMIVALMGYEKAKSGQVISAKDLLPLYLRKSEAEIKFG